MLASFRSAWYDLNVKPMILYPEKFAPIKRYKLVDFQRQELRL